MDAALIRAAELSGGPFPTAQDIEDFLKTVDPRSPVTRTVAKMFGELNEARKSVSRQRRKKEASVSDSGEAHLAPQGWAFAQGQFLPISQNAALFTLVGSKYGVSQDKVEKIAIDLNSAASEAASLASDTERHKSSNILLETIALLRKRLYNKEEREAWEQFIEFYSKKSAVDPTSLPIEERLAILETYAKRSKGEGVAEYARQLLPELAELSTSREPSNSQPVLPDTAPATWRNDKKPSETPPEFVLRIYGPWLGKGFTRATVRQLDPSLDQAIGNWRRRHEWPADVDLPTKSEQTTRWVERVKQEGLASVIPEGTPQEVLRAARRLTMAKHRRNQEHQK